MVRRLIGAALLTIGLGRLITAPVEAALLFATLAGARPLARFVADRTPLGTIVRSLPPIARYAVAAVLTFIVAQVTIAPFYGLARTDPGRVPEYFSVIVTMAIGLVLVELITTPATPGRSRAAAAASTAVVVVVGGGLVLVALAAPIAVLADDGAGLIDTYGKEFLAALAGWALPLALVAAWKAFPLRDPPPKPPPPDEPGRDPDKTHREHGIHEPAAPAAAPAGPAASPSDSQIDLADAELADNYAGSPLADATQLQVPDASVTDDADRWLAAPGKVILNNGLPVATPPSGGAAQAAADTASAAPSSSAAGSSATGSVASGTPSSGTPPSGGDPRPTPARSRLPHQATRTRFRRRRLPDRLISMP